MIEAPDAPSVVPADDERLELALRDFGRDLAIAAEGYLRACELAAAVLVQFGEACARILGQEVSTMHLASDLTDHQYPAIARAALEMSYDNGGVNRDRSEADVLTDLNVTLAIIDCFVSPDEMAAINAWLATLSEDDLMTVVAGEEGEGLAIMERGPPRVHQVINSIFHGAA